MSLGRFARACALVWLLSSVACSDGSSSPSDDELPTRVTVQVGSKGGTVKASGGMTLEIPEGALEKNVKITATNAGQSAPKEVQAKQVSDLYEFGPEGTKFAKDVKITFHTEKEEQRAEVYFTKEDSDEFERIPSQKSGKEVVAYVKHFSKGFVGVPNDEEPDAAAPVDVDAGAELDAGDGPDAGSEDAGQTSAMDAGATGVDASTKPDGGATQPSDAGDPGPTDAGAIDAGPAKKHIVVQSRDRYGALVNQSWAAFQDGQGAWQPLPAPAQAGVYEFDIAGTSPNYGVAFVCSQSDLLNSWGTITLEPATTGALTVVTNGPPCTVGNPPVDVTLNVTLTLTPDVYWRVGYSLLTGGPGNYAGGPATFPTILHANQATDMMYASGPMNPFMNINRILIQRDVNIFNDTNVNASMDAGVAPLGTLSGNVTNATDAAVVEVRYVTRNTDDGLLLNTTTESGTSTRTVSFASVPESVRRTADRYLIVGNESSSTAFRTASLSTYPTGNLTVSLPPTFSTTFASLNAPYLRPTFSFTPVTGANGYAFSVAYAPVRGQLRAFDLALNPAWLTGAGPQVLTFPDFSAVPGFQSAWVAPSGGSVSVKSSARAAKSDAQGDQKSESGQSSSIPPP